MPDFGNGRSIFLFLKFATHVQFCVFSISVSGFGFVDFAITFQFGLRKGPLFGVWKVQALQQFFFTVRLQHVRDSALTPPLAPSWTQLGETGASRLLTTTSPWQEVGHWGNCQR